MDAADDIRRIREALADREPREQVTRAEFVRRLVARLHEGEPIRFYSPPDRIEH
jgi:hypothetical protein